MKSHEIDFWGHLWAARASYMPTCNQKWLVEQESADRVIRVRWNCLWPWAAPNFESIKKMLEVETLDQHCEKSTSSFCNQVLLIYTVNYGGSFCASFRLWKANALAHWMVEGVREARQKMTRMTKKWKVTKLTSEAIFGQLVLHIWLPATRNDS